MPNLIKRMQRQLNEQPTNSGRRWELHLVLMDKHAPAGFIYVDPDQPSIMESGRKAGRHLGTVAPPDDWATSDPMI